MEPALHPTPQASLAVPTQIHADLAELAFLLGAWRGEGEGTWPPAGAFRYGEDVTFEHVGDDFLLYAQRSWALDDGAPIHFERGFVLPAGPGRAELVLAHPNGVAEVSVGTVEAGVVELESAHVTVSPTGSPVTAFRRRIEVEGDVLTYELHMATRDVPLTWHVRSRLVRAS